MIIIHEDIVGPENNGGGKDREDEGKLGIELTICKKTSVRLRDYSFKINK